MNATTHDESAKPAGSDAPTCSASLTKEQFQILHHTVNRSAGHKYCGGGKTMDQLVEMGLMEYLGTPAWCPDPYYGITTKGLAALRQNARGMAPGSAVPDSESTNELGR
jgi:hypothetical protein